MISLFDDKEKDELLRGKIKTIDRLKGRITLLLRNGLESCGSYLGDLNGLREGMYVVAARMNDSYVILDKGNSIPRLSTSGTTQAVFVNRLYGTGGIDIWNGKIYVSDHFHCQIKIYSEATGAYLGSLSTTMGQPASQTYYPGDIRASDGKCYLSLPYADTTVSVTMTSNGLGFIPASICFYRDGFAQYPVGLALNDDYLYVSSMNGRITRYERDVTSYNGTDSPYPLSNGVGLGQFCVDNEMEGLLLSCSLFFFGSETGVFLIDQATDTIVRQFGTAGLVATNTISPTGVWKYGNRVYISDGLITTGPSDYHGVSHPKILVCDYDTGDLLFTFGSRGDKPGCFLCPTGVCVYDDIVYVTDLTRAKVQRFTLDGLFLGELL